jgi:hypothetical protein
MLTPRSYKSPWVCFHRRELRKIANGELCCLECLHVAVRVDGTRPSYPMPSQAIRDQLRLLAERAGAE